MLLVRVEVSVADAGMAHLSPCLSLSAASSEASLSSSCSAWFNICVPTFLRPWSSLASSKQCDTPPKEFTSATFCLRVSGSTWAKLSPLPASRAERRPTTSSSFIFWSFSVWHPESFAFSALISASTSSVYLLTTLALESGTNPTKTSAATLARSPGGVGFTMQASEICGMEA